MIIKTYLNLENRIDMSIALIDWPDTFWRGHHRVKIKIVKETTLTIIVILNNCVQFFSSSRIKRILSSNSSTHLPYSKSSRQVWQTFFSLAQVWQTSVFLNLILAPGHHLNTVKGRAQILHSFPYFSFVWNTIVLSYTCQELNMTLKRLQLTFHKIPTIDKSYTHWIWWSTL